MKGLFYDFFVWSAGSDREILDRTGHSEHTKHAGYGGLVWVPAVLGLFSMMYAVSTLTDRAFVYIGAGIVWAGIVFTFDRFIVATFRKSDSPRKDLFSFLFLSRLLFSIGIGVLVSHPIVLLVFDDSLEQELFAMKEEGEKAIYTQYENTINVVRTRDSLLKGEVELKLAERACKEKLLLFEMSGKDTTMSCGTTSGLKQYGPRATEIKEEIRYLNEEIAALRSKNDTKIADNTQEITKLQAERQDKLKGFNDQFSYNYLAREVALERLEAKPVGGTSVKWTKWFLIVFFVLVDILPVFFKASTKPGEYDRLLDKENDSTANSYPAYERAQEDRVRKAYIDQLAQHRLDEVQRNFKENTAAFPELKEALSQYLNVNTPFEYGKSAAGQPDPVQQLWDKHSLDWLRYAFYALAQSGFMVAFTRDWSYLTAGVWIFFLLNVLIGQVVNRTVKPI
jgi:hypothetical protein